MLDFFGSFNDNTSYPYLRYILNELKKEKSDLLDCSKIKNLFDSLTHTFDRQ